MQWITTRAVFDMDGNLLEQEGYWYDGAMAYCGGGGGDNEVEETPEEKELADISAEKFKEYQNTFVPLENKMMDEVSDFGSATKREQAAGEAAVAAQQNAPGVPAGLDPSSGKFDKAVSEAANATGQARGQAASSARMAERKRGIEGLNSLISIGKGQSAQAVDTLSKSARASATDASRDAMREFNRDAAWANLAGNVAGAGARYGLNGGSGIAGPQQRQGLAAQNQGNDFFQHGTNQALRSNRGGR